MSADQARAWVGTSAWKNPQWRGQFYPAGLAQHRELRYAADRLASLEVNTTFYGLPAPSTYRSWRTETPDDFVFSVKGNSVVTHDNLLRNPARNVADFLGSGVLQLGDKLGPVLWQIPPSLQFRPDVVEAFLAILPHSVSEARRLVAENATGDIDPGLQELPDRPIRHAFEARHASFLDPAFSELLSRYDVATTITNFPDSPDIRGVTSGFVYVRLHSSESHYPNGYYEAALGEWTALAASWLDGSDAPDGVGRDVFIYFDNPDHDRTRGPFDALRLQQLLDGPEATPRGSEAASIQLPLWDE